MSGASVPESVSAMRCEMRMWLGLGLGEMILFQQVSVSQSHWYSSQDVGIGAIVCTYYFEVMLRFA